LFFPDKTALQLFRNTVEHWHKGKRPIRPMPKDKTKISPGGRRFVLRVKRVCFVLADYECQIHIEIIRDAFECFVANGGFNDPKHTNRLTKAYLQKKNIPKVID